MGKTGVSGHPEPLNLQNTMFIQFAASEMDQVNFIQPFHLLHKQESLEARKAHVEMREKKSVPLWERACARLSCDDEESELP